MKKIIPLSLFLVLLVAIAGCGYTTRSTLPSRFRTIHIDHFVNKIDYSSEKRRNIYFPLLEVTARNAVINRYQFDGNLRIAEKDVADLILEAELTQYRRSALRYTDNDDVQEYRVYVVINMTLWDTANNVVKWEEGGFTGEATYFIEGPLVTTEESAVDEAVLDLARRIVERTIEDW